MSPRLLVVSVFAVLTIALAPVSASAQDDLDLLSAASTEHARELASIDRQSAAATSLYITSLALHIGGLGGAIGGTIAGFCIYTCTSGDHAWSTVGLVSAGLSLVGAMVLMPIAIGLDVGSGRRRRELERSTPLRLELSAGGIALSGTF